MFFAVLVFAFLPNNKEVGVEFQSTGRLTYGPDIRAAILVDRTIADYYRRLIPAYLFVQPQRYPPHITVVRIGVENPWMMEVWGKHEGEEVDFTYSGEIKFDGRYYYLDVKSDRIAEIRIELCLPRYRFDDNKRYHITIGNCKDVIETRTS